MKERRGKQQPLRRPGWDEYYMGIAHAVATRSNCVRRHVGALIVVQNAIIGAGYNGAPIGVRNCSEGGCPRCASDALPGEGYDACICVHAEQNAIVLAARHGSATNGGTLYTTLRPCFGCAKEAIQAGIREIVFEEPYAYESGLEGVYRRLIVESGLKLRRFAAGRARYTLGTRKADRAWRPSRRSTESSWPWPAAGKAPRGPGSTRRRDPR